MTDKLILYAPRVHMGGGRVLLEAVLQLARPDWSILVDQRLASQKDFSALQPIVIPSGFKSYFEGERKLRACVHRDPGSTVLCFSSLPPRERLAAKTVVFVQNRFVLEECDEVRFPLKVSLRITFERAWFARYWKNTDQFIVQSESMARALGRRCPGARVAVFPFVDREIFSTAEKNGICLQRDAESEEKTRAKQMPEPDLDFVYAASPDPHKNHGNLLQAWALLAEKKLFPVLGLTVSESSSVAAEAHRLNTSLQTRIEVLGEIPQERRFAVYARSRALIFPSYFETFGLPLLEASAFGLPILAGELDYVRDSVRPNETFDPHSPVSISRAVQRWLGIVDSHPRLSGSSEFLSFISNLTHG